MEARRYLYSVGDAWDVLEIAAKLEDSHLAMDAVCSLGCEDAPTEWDYANEQPIGLRHYSAIIPAYHGWLSDSDISLLDKEPEPNWTEIGKVFMLVAQK